MMIELEYLGEPMPTSLLGVSGWLIVAIIEPGYPVGWIVSSSYPWRQYGTLPVGILPFDQRTLANRLKS